MLHGKKSAEYCPPVRRVACCERCVQEATGNKKNHLYWFAASCNGNADLISQKWLLILNHVVDVHEGQGAFIRNIYMDL